MKARIHRAAVWPALLAAALFFVSPAWASVRVTSDAVRVGNMFATNGTVTNAWRGDPILPGNLVRNATIVQTAGAILDGGLVANLNDGLMVSSNIYTEPQPEWGFPSGGYIIDQTANVARLTPDSKIKVLLDGPHDLSRIDVFSAAHWYRDGQKWEVFTSTDGGNTWSDRPLASADYKNSTESGYFSRRVTVRSGIPGAAIARGVNALRFDIHLPAGNEPDNNPTGFSEIAVYGVAINAASATRQLPAETPLTAQLVAEKWGGEGIDPSRNLAANAVVTQLSGEAPAAGRLANVNDGRLVSEVSAVGGQYTLAETANSWLPAAGSEIVFALDGIHDLGKIDVFTSFAWSRTGQNYDIHTSTDGGSSWSKLVSVNYPNENLHPASGWLSRRVTVERPSAVLARGVNAVKFVISGNDPVPGGLSPSVFNEIAIYGATQQWIYKNGQRFFPIGISHYPNGATNAKFLQTVVASSEAQIQEVAAAGVNWAYGYMSDARGEQWLDNEMLDRCGRNGICVSAMALNWNPKFNWITKDSFHVPGSKFDLAVRDIMNNPNLLNYYGMDEAISLIGINKWPSGLPEDNYTVTYDTLTGARQFLKSIDPGRILMYVEGAPDNAVANFGEENTRLWVNNLTDVTGINYYPVRDDRSFPASELLVWPAVYLDWMARLVDPDPKADGWTRYNPGKPLIACWQSGPLPPNRSLPKLEEMRASVYSLIIHGAKGLWSMHEGFLDLSKPEDAECWNNYKKVSRELAELEPVLVSDDIAYNFLQATPPPYVPDYRRVESGGLLFGHPSLIGVVKEYNGHRYLIAMNWSSENLGKRSISVPGWNHAANGGKTPVMFEDRSVDASSTTWMDNFGPWEVHVYTDKPQSLQVEEPAGTQLPGQGAAKTAFGPFPVGETAGRVYTIRNKGAVPLTGIALDKAGPASGDFSLTPPAASSLSPGASATFSAVFAPTAPGPRTAQIFISSSDTSSSPFVIGLAGFGLSEDSDTDGDGLTDVAEFKMSALGFDWQTAQPALVGTLFGHAYRAGLYTSNHVAANAAAFNLFTQTQFEDNRQAGRAEVTGNPAAYGLYDSNSIMDLRMGGVMLRKNGTNATVVFQPQTTTDVATRAFADHGAPVSLTVPMPGDKGFLRIQAKPGP